MNLTTFPRFFHHLDKPDRAGEQHRCNRKTGKDYQETPWTKANESAEDDNRAVSQFVARGCRIH